MRRRTGHVLAILIVVLVGGLSGSPSCRRKQEEGLRTPDVPYEPTPHEVVSRLLELGSAGPHDVVYDLGCGDGRIVIAAVKEHHARGVCVDIDPQRIRESRANAARAGVEAQITFRNEDLFTTDISGATLVTLFLWPEVNLRLRPKLLRELAPGTRGVSYMHDMGGWQPEQVVPVSVDGRTHSLYLWRIPDRDEQ